MDSLSETVWDVVISGTGLAQSLLALYVEMFCELFVGDDVSD